MSGSLEIEEYRAPQGGFGAAVGRVVRRAWRISDYSVAPSVNFRIHRLWRPDSRYPGTMSVRQHECGGVEFSFDALRHGGKPRPEIVVDPDDVDHLILSLLEVRQRTPEPEAPSSVVDVSSEQADLVKREGT